MLALAVNMCRLEKDGSWLFLSIISTGSGFFSGTDAAAELVASVAASLMARRADMAPLVQAGAPASQCSKRPSIAAYAVGTPSLKAPM